MLYSGQNINELRPSPRIVAVMLVLLAFALVWVDTIWPEPAKRILVQQFELLLYASAAAILILDYWQPWLGRYVAVAGLVGLVTAGFVWLSSPEFLMLMILPVIAGATLLNLRTATVTAGVETAGILLLASLGEILVTPGELSAAIITVWAGLGMMAALYHPIYQREAWLGQYIKETHDSLAEARQNKLEMGQMLAELAHANRELALLSERLTAMRLVAEEAQKAKTAFAAKISHEFRTPLNMIIGLIDTLTETPEVYGGEVPPRLLKDLDIVYRNSHHLASMVEDVLDLSQTEAGQLTLHRGWVDLTAIIENATEVVRPLLEKKRLTLEVLLADDLPAVYCDETRMRQVIMNLISNAARYTEQGGVTVSVKEADQHVVVSVIDTGPGIARDEADRIFEPFYQSKNGLWRDQGGSGLGLSISKQFVAHHGGQLWLESQPGIGSNFSFRLPITPTPALPTEAKRWISQDWVFLERAAWPKLPELPYKQRIIVCDESGDLIHRFDHHDEIEFVEARDLSQAVREVQKCPAHAVILNTTSPPNLASLVEQARQKMPDTPIVGCTVSPRLDRALTAGAIDYLVKPVRRIDLAGALQLVTPPVRRVLIVDDNPDILELFSRMLSICDKSLAIETASSGEEALAVMRRQPPDLVLLDIIMPEMDGWQLLSRKGRDETIKDIPTILISAEDLVDQPQHSKMLMATMGQGVSLTKVLAGSLRLSALLLTPDPVLDPALEGTAGDEQAWADKGPRPTPGLTPHA